MADKTSTNQYEALKQATKQKLWQALARLKEGKPDNPELQRQGYRLDVNSLAKEAGVSRNAIYTNHRELLEELREAKQRSRVMPKSQNTAEKEIAKLWKIIKALKNRIQQLATNNALLLCRIQQTERGQK